MHCFPPSCTEQAWILLQVEQEGVSVKGSPHFNPDPDAETLYKAMKGIGCWEVLAEEEKGTTEDEMGGWHHRLYGHEYE